MNEIVKPAVVLLIITSVAASLLGFVSSVTEAPIEAQKIKTESEAMQAVLAEADSFEPFYDGENVTYEGSISDVKTGYSGTDIVGYVVTVNPNGFSGSVSTMVGIRVDGTLGGIKVLSHSETPGLGALATDTSFSDQYIDKVGPLSVIKAGTPGDSEIQAITSATITSVAVTDGANEAYDWFVENGGAN